jgi:hypothetical protein
MNCGPGRFTGTPTSRSGRWLRPQVVAGPASPRDNLSRSTDNPGELVYAVDKHARITSPTVNVAAGRVAGMLD